MDSTENKNISVAVTEELLDNWATDPSGPVALYLKQKLVPVESEPGEPAVVYPPTYADIGYNIDTLSDGKCIALIDSVGSQANRMEPIFKKSPEGQPINPLAELIPQIEIVLSRKKSEITGEEHIEKRSILDLAHRGADAVVHSSPALMEQVSRAFEALKHTGNAAPICAIAPTSLLFGVWDSRGTGEKRPRLIRSIIRAWDVEIMHSAAQFNSIWKALDEEQKAELDKEKKAKKKKLSEVGLADAPAVFRTDKVKHFLSNGPNPAARVLGGVLARGGIYRDVTINLVALRGLRGGDSEETDTLRRYLLGLSLLAATHEMDLFLREGCHLRYTGQDDWHVVPRRGTRQSVDLTSEKSKKIIQEFASINSRLFIERQPEELEYEFDIKAAKKLLAKKDKDTPEGE